MNVDIIEEVEKKAFENALYKSKTDRKTGDIIVCKIYAVLKNQGFSDVLVVEDESFQKYNTDRLRFKELIYDGELKSEKYERRLSEAEKAFFDEYTSYGKYVFENRPEAKKMKDYKAVHPKYTNAYARLCRNIIGQNEMKRTLLRLGSVYKYAQERERFNIATDSIHKVLAFIGPPGTGKTTAAKYFGEMMLEQNIISGGRLISISGAQLKAGYIGQTTERVHKIFENNDIVIIDEAYSLVNYNAGEKTDSFSQEALAQLCIEVEEHSRDKLIIFAGYGGSKNDRYNKMKEFMDENPGIASRITFTVNFDTYGVDEMLSIFELLTIRNNYELEEGWRVIARPFFEERVHCENFGNGREARRLLETAMTFAAESFIDWSYKNSILENDDYERRKRLSILSCADIKKAVELLSL